MECRTRRWADWNLEVLYDEDYIYLGYFWLSFRSDSDLVLRDTVHW